MLYRSKNIFRNSICVFGLLFAGCAAGNSGNDEHKSRSVSSDDANSAVLGVAVLGHDENGNIEYELSYDGLERSYIVHIPPNYTPNEKSALVMSLHGRPGTNHSLMKSQRWEEVGDRENFVVVYPQGASVEWRGKAVTHWNALNMETGVDDVGFLKHVVDRVHADYGTDPKRVYVAGFSNGGMMVSRLVCEAGDVFTAMASVAGVGSTAHTDCVPSDVTPIAFIHGEKDELPPEQGRTNNSRPVQETLDMFINAYACSVQPEVRQLADVDKADQTRTTHYKYSGCRNGASVEYYFIENGGHTWPGNKPAPRLGNTSQDFKATEELWSFFKQYRME
ncbi:alpha/beta hydrolase family esterase [Hirschia litorea]|uniref:Alpha/beta hydrolase family esterase n=1 Tax=Hirschia litorea TaxID=1199156 RepID=A0ABW2IKW7_9PROT